MRRLFVTLTASFLLATPAQAAEIWMFAGPYVANPAPGWEWVRRDMGGMWRADAPWKTAAGAVNVIQFPPTSIDRARDSDLREAVADIKRRNIAFAVGTGLLIRSDRCRAKTEAYVDQKALEAMLDKLRRNGANVKYVTMDEPYFYGHRDSSPTSCHESTLALAQALKQSIAIVRRYFPDARIGTDEVITKDRVDDIVRWVDVYQQITGEKLAYLHADVAWQPENLQNLLPLAKALKQRDVALGIDYNAAPKNQEPWFDPNSNQNSDIGWVRNALSHAAKIESGLGIQPDHAVLTTWVRYPSRMLPETEPGTFTNFVLRYVQRRELPAR